MRGSFIVAAFIASAAAASIVAIPASAQKLPAVKGKPYSIARSVLLSRGLSVQFIPQSQFDRCAPGREAVCAAYPETIICRGTGRASCEFLLYGAGTAYLVTTTGEDDDPRVESVERQSEDEIEALFDE